MTTKSAYSEDNTDFFSLYFNSRFKDKIKGKGNPRAELS